MDRRERLERSLSGGHVFGLKTKSTKDLRRRECVGMGFNRGRAWRFRTNGRRGLSEEESVPRERVEEDSVLREPLEESFVPRVPVEEESVLRQPRASKTGAVRV